MRRGWYERSALLVKSQFHPGAALARRLTVYIGYWYIGRVALRRPTYFILAALVDGPLHGYGIVKRIEELTDGSLRLRAGTLYAALDRLAGQGLVAAGGEEVVSGRLRRYYRLTPDGHAAILEEARELRAAADTVLAARAAPEPA